MSAARTCIIVFPAVVCHHAREDVQLVCLRWVSGLEYQTSTPIAVVHPIADLVVYRIHQPVKPL